MKTDPITAAYAYRQALDRIQRAQTLHEARRLAIRALEVTFDRPEETHVSVASGYGSNTKQPYVTIGIANPTESANPVVQIVSDQARQIAMQILEAADAAESDGFLVTWLTNSMELSDGQLATVLADFRAWRARKRNDER